MCHFTGRGGGELAGARAGTPRMLGGESRRAMPWVGVGVLLLLLLV